MKQELASLQWYAVQPESAHGWWIVSKDPDGETCIDESGDGGFNEDTAKFISATPDMYRAHAENARILGYLLDELQGIAPGNKLAALGACLMRSRNVLAKAEGER